MASTMTFLHVWAAAGTASRLRTKSQPCEHPPRAPLHVVLSRTAHPVRGSRELPHQTAVRHASAMPSSVKQSTTMMAKRAPQCRRTAPRSTWRRAHRPCTSRPAAAQSAAKHRGPPVGLGERRLERGAEGEQRACDDAAAHAEQGSPCSTVSVEAARCSHASAQTVRCRPLLSLCELGTTIGVDVRYLGTRSRERASVCGAGDREERAACCRLSPGGALAQASHAQRPMRRCWPASMAGRPRARRGRAWRGGGGLGSCRAVSSGVVEDASRARAPPRAVSADRPATADERAARPSGRQASCAKISLSRTCSVDV